MPNDTTIVVTGAKAREKILKGVNVVYDAVRRTLGPEGRNALLPRTYNRGPRNTNDGVTISENIMLKDEHERIAADFFKEGAKKTNELAGDGTTTTTVIGGFLINQTFRKLSEQDIPSASLTSSKSKTKGVRALRKEMKDAKDLVIEEIKKVSKPIKTLSDLEKIAVVSVGKEDETIAKTIAKMVWEVGRDSSGNFTNNHIEVTEGYKGTIETEVVRGMRFPSKVAHRAFVTKPERYEMEANDVHVLVTNYKLDNPFVVVGILDRVKVPKIALFAPDFSPGVIKSLIETTKQGLFCYPVKCPALRTAQLEDLAAYTGATVIDKDTSKKLQNVDVSDLGFAEKIVIKDTENKEDGVLLGGRGEKSNTIAQRIEILRGQMNESRDELTKMSVEKRIANLASAVGVIRVGASTSAEGLYLKLKIEDGVFACKAALEEGYVQGGGLCLKKIADSLKDNILCDALRAPYEQIQKNAGGELDIGKDIIDPTKVVRLEVEHGVSIAASMITTDIVISNVREKAPAEGYEAIADAIISYVRLEARHLGILKENEDFEEQIRNDEFEKVLLADKG